MNYTNFEVNGKDYKLVLTTRTLVDLERKLERSPMDILMDTANDKMPKAGDLVLVLWASLQKFHHNMSVNDCYDLFDAYLEEHTIMDFMTVVLDIFKVSGIFKDETEEDEKN